MPHIKWNGRIFKFCAVLHLKKVIKWNLRYFQFYIHTGCPTKIAEVQISKEILWFSVVARGFHSSKVVAQFSYVT